MLLELRFSMRLAGGRCWKMHFSKRVAR
jgi:hypothetical protein